MKAKAEAKPEKKLIPNPVPRFGTPFCQRCGGYGGSYENPCRRCNGTGYKL